MPACFRWDPVIGGPVPRFIAQIPDRCRPIGQQLGRHHPPLGPVGDKPRHGRIETANGDIGPRTKRSYFLAVTEDTVRNSCVLPRARGIAIARGNFDQCVSAGHHHAVNLRSFDRIVNGHITAKRKTQHKLL